MLTEKRKADREKMAAMVEALCAEIGAECERMPAGSREIMLSMQLGALRATVDFDGDTSLHGVHVVPWHIAPDARSVRLAPSFGSVNPYHGRKATHIARGVNALLAELRRGFEAARDGSAFVED